MGQVVIEGVVSSDISDRGEQHTVEWTDQIKGYVRNGLVRVIDHVTPEPVVKSVKRSRVKQDKRTDPAVLPEGEPARLGD